MTASERLMDVAKRGDLDALRSLARDHAELLNAKDDTVATALHYGAFEGHSEVAQFLVEQGADVNARDDRYGATPAGWAIEYPREMGGFLGIELEDFAFAIRHGDVLWAERFLGRFPRLRESHDRSGAGFRQMAQESGRAELVRRFDLPSAH